MIEDNNKNTAYNAQRLKDRATTELIGICKGVLFDGSISTGEAENLLIWLKANPQVATDWFGRDLYNTLEKFLADGIIDTDEEVKLLTILTDLTGSPSINTAGVNASTSLPFCKTPPEQIPIEGCHFALTGNFTFMKRKQVEAFITANGGKVKKNANANCDYLVIGEVGSTAWIHSSFGRKIEQAIETREKGGVIAIISEEYFLNNSIPTLNKAKND